MRVYFKIVLRPCSGMIQQLTWYPLTEKGWMPIHQHNCHRKNWPSYFLTFWTFLTFADSSNLGMTWQLVVFMVMTNMKITDFLWFWYCIRIKVPFPWNITYTANNNNNKVKEKIIYPFTYLHMDIHMYL